MHSISLIIFYILATHLLVRHVGLLRCPLSLPGALFLRFVLFWLRRCGVGFPWEISIGIGAWTTCIFVHTCSLVNFAGFRSSGNFFAHRILLSTILWHLWHRCLACTCRGSQLFSFLEVLGNNSCNPFYRWFSWDRTIVCPGAFVLQSTISSRSGFDDVWWPILIYQTHVSCLSLKQVICR